MTNNVAVPYIVIEKMNPESAEHVAALSRLSWSSSGEGPETTYYLWDRDSPGGGWTAVSAILFIGQVAIPITTLIDWEDPADVQSARDSAIGYAVRAIFTERYR